MQNVLQKTNNNWVSLVRKGQGSLTSSVLAFSFHDPRVPKAHKTTDLSLSLSLSLTHTHTHTHVYTWIQKKNACSVVSNSATPWTAACQAPLSTGSSQWSIQSQRDLPEFHTSKHQGMFRVLPLSHPKKNGFVFSRSQGQRISSCKRTF